MQVCIGFSFTVFFTYWLLQRGLCNPEILRQQADIGRHGDFCESKTVNYITHTLPQQCLRTAWSDRGIDRIEIPTPSRTASTDQHNQPTLQPGIGNIQDQDNEVTANANDPSTEPNDGGTKGNEPIAFMSFEDWKEMMLRRSEQQPPAARRRTFPDEGTETPNSMVDNGLDSLGDDGEIALNFDTLDDKSTSYAPSTSLGTSEEQSDHERGAVLYEDGKTRYSLGKDAGKTCKERFSYSSFDAGATVLKASPGAKNVKAILVEHKDSYMLLDCAAENKYVIVELSDDILVDTIVLANFEFFSSMIRQFRVSVSDRYPVKMDKWKELGTFEARNSRDIQPFLVENPLIWAKYVRIEFLNHYGNEYYCPVSLLRVHGTRMLESWKDAEAGIDEEDADEDSPSTNTSLSDSDGSIDNPTERHSPMLILSSHPPYHIDLSMSCLPNGFALQSNTQMCPAEIIVDTESGPNGTYTGSKLQAHASVCNDRVPNSALNMSVSSQTGPTLSSSVNDTHVPARTATISSSSLHSAHSANTTGSFESMTTTVESTTISSSAVKSASSITSALKNKTSTPPTALPASPTVQESFFKAVSKRLQLLESNITLSLKYIEDQSKYLQDSLQQAERRQINRVDAFLNNLNLTVLSELRGFRQQYDQIWQSTVIALETHREQSQREIFALSSRLNILAEEVVFQKRMAIMQSIILLSCLILVIFSRGIGNPVIPMSFDTLTPTVGRQQNAQLDSDAGRQVDDYLQDSTKFTSTRRVASADYGRESSINSAYESTDHIHGVPLTPISDDIPETSAFISNTQMYPQRSSPFSETPPSINGAHTFTWNETVQCGSLPSTGLFADTDVHHDGPTPLDHPLFVSPAIPAEWNEINMPSNVDLNRNGRDHGSSRRVSVQTGRLRKPLPALPEHP
jgi:hypothetical protein